MSRSHSIHGTEGDYMGTFTLFLGILGGVASLMLWRGIPQGVTLPRRTVALASVGAFGLAAILTLVDFLRETPTFAMPGVSGGRGVGLYLTLICAGAGAALSFLVLRSTPDAPSAPTPPAAP